MTQNELNLLIADATGDDPKTIDHHGFTLLTDDDRWQEDERPPLVIDWDELDGIEPGRARRRG